MPNVILINLKKIICVMCVMLNLEKLSVKFDLETFEVYFILTECGSLVLTRFFQ